MIEYSYISLLRVGDDEHGRSSTYTILSDFDKHHINRFYDKGAEIVGANLKSECNVYGQYGLSSEYVKATNKYPKLKSLVADGVDEYLNEICLDEYTYLSLYLETAVIGAEALGTEFGYEILDEYPLDIGGEAFCAI